MRNFSTVCLQSIWFLTFSVALSFVDHFLSKITDHVNEDNCIVQIFSTHTHINVYDGPYTIHINVYGGYPGARKNLGPGRK